DLRRSEEGFKDVIQKYPKFLPAYIMLAKTYYYKEDLKTAYQIFEKSISLQPNVLSYVWLGKISMLQNQESQAFQFYLKAIALDYSNPLAHYEMAKYYQKIGKIEKAVYHYNYAISYENMYPEMKYDLAMLYSELKINDKARALLTSILRAPVNETMKSNIQEKLSGLEK
ncbi:MAG: hypothetical protein JXQ23_00410, partial [Clostridia bacterium]|nr:hypothetical protein [Clostridia bacterium]